MQQSLLLLFLFLTTTVSAQLVITEPAAPTDDQSVTITFDATQGTGGLADCNCDVYVHTGVVTNTDPGWQYVVTTWGQENDAWKMKRVEGENNLYTYTYEPSLREYFSVPAGETIEKLALVFRNGDGTKEGKATGNQDIFIDISQGGGVLGINTSGDPETEFWALGRPLPVQFGATVEATLEIFDNEELVASTTGTELTANVVLATPGRHTIRFVATTADGQTDSAAFDLDGRLEVAVTSPTADIINAAAGNEITLAGSSYINSRITINDGNQTVYDQEDVADFSQTFTLPDGGVTTYTLTATLGEETATDRVTFVTSGPEEVGLPADFTPGATPLPDGGIRLGLRAPGKTDVFVLHNFNDFAPTAASRMKISPADGTFLLDLTDLPDGEDLLYQYLIDGDLVQPDPYSKLVLDPFNDPFIGEETFAGIPEYPSALATGIVTWERRSAPEYTWNSEADYGKPDPTRMVVYELLVRDFLDDHSFASLTDTLDYLSRLGVNAIELMPVNEFENNLSWGYNPSFHMALDKYYGSPEDLKAFVDACHERGLAVIVDIVYNHAFGQSPLARMWWDTLANQPAADSPYFNPIPKHNFNVGNDFNHESELTQEYVKVTTRYWLEEFRIDGYRWDLSKGFTQNNTLGNTGAWGQYDAARIARLKDYADHIWSVDNDAYMIMEHLAEPREEEELAGYGNGMYFWSGFQPHDAYLEASMGYHENNKSNFRQALSSNRGFSGKTLIAYMESHDEERMQYKNEQFGNRSGDYDIREQATGLDRVELASTFFYTLPGPKMLWQFGELGYDFNINYCIDDPDRDDCRTGNKPIRWDYRDDENRQDVYNWIANLNYLRNNFDIFHGEVADVKFSGALKSFNVTGADGTATVVGNFDVNAADLSGVFPATGTWYDYATGEALEVTSTSQAVTLAPGEYHVYLSREIEPGGGSIGTSTSDRTITRLELTVTPNPTEGPLLVSFDLPTSRRLRIDLLDVSGRMIRPLFNGTAVHGQTRLPLRVDQVPAGLYFLRVTDGLGSGTQKIVIK